MIRLLLEILGIAVIIFLFVADLDGKSIWQHTSDKGLKPTIDRIWNGPAPTKGK